MTDTSTHRPIVADYLLPDAVDRQAARERLARLRSALAVHDVGAAVFFDAINIRYACGVRNMQINTTRNPGRYVFVPVDGPVVLFEYRAARTSPNRTTPSTRSAVLAVSIRFTAATTTARISPRSSTTSANSWSPPVSPVNDSVSSDPRSRPSRPSSLRDSTSSMRHRSSIAPSRSKLQPSCN